MIMGVGNLLERDRFPGDQYLVSSATSPTPQFFHKGSRAPHGYHTTGMEKDLHWPVKGVFVGQGDDDALG